MQRPSVKNILRKKSAKDKEGYITLRVGVPGSSTPELRAYGYRIHEDQWNKEYELVEKSHKDATQINAEITAKKQKYDKIFKDDTGPLSRERICDLLDDGRKSHGSFMLFYAKYVDLEGKRNSDGYAAILLGDYNTFKKYAGDSVRFEDVTLELLEGYESYLRSKEYADTTIHTKMKHLKQPIDKSIKRRLIMYEAIDGYRWPDVGEPETHYLTLEQTEIIAQKLYAGDYSYDSEMQHIAAFFLVECYSGIRFSDWGRFEIEKLINNNNLKVSTKKTGAPVYLPLNVFKRLGKVIEYIKTHNLKFKLTEQTTNRILKHTIAKDLRLKFNLTTHVGRHTCGTLLGEMGYSTRAIAEVLAITEDTAKRYIKNTRRSLLNEFEKYGGL